MPQTQLVAEFVEKLGSFYELVDDRTCSEKFTCHDISCQNGDIPNGDIFDHSESSALRKGKYSIGTSEIELTKKKNNWKRYKETHNFSFLLLKIKFIWMGNYC